MDDYCATNMAILSVKGVLSDIMRIIDCCPLRLARESLGSSQEELAFLAEPKDPEVRKAVKAGIVGLEAGLWSKNVKYVPAWTAIIPVLCKAGFNVRDLEIQLFEWRKDLDDFLAEEVKHLTDTRQAKPGPK